jgi:hypothetical protein
MSYNRKHRPHTVDPLESKIRSLHYMRWPKKGHKTLIEAKEKCIIVLGEPTSSCCFAAPRKARHQEKKRFRVAVFGGHTDTG